MPAKPSFAREAVSRISYSGVSHVYSHRGCPWNELADCLAKFCVSHSQVLDTSGFWFRPVSIPAWPVHCKDGLVDPGSTDSWDPRASTSWCGLPPTAPDQRSRRALAQIRLVSVNVQTLGETGQEGQDCSDFCGNSLVPSQRRGQ